MVSGARASVREGRWEALRAASRTRWRAAGVDHPRLDAELLLGEAIGASGRATEANRGAEVPPPAARAFGEMVRRRLRREPVAYILGRKGFRNLELAVDRRVLVPRPETELLVEVGVERRPAEGARRRHRLGRDRPGGRRRAPRLRGCSATDASARRARGGAAPTPSASASPAGSIFSKAACRPGEGFDLVLANLPYVAERDWARLEPEMTKWEPTEALLAGPDGLDAYRAHPPPPLLWSTELARSARQPRSPVEVGGGAGRGGVGADAGSRLRPAPRRGRDLAGIERVVVGARGSDERRASGQEVAGESARRPRGWERSIAGGGVVVFPANGLYGLACDPLDTGGHRPDPPDQGARRRQVLRRSCTSRRWRCGSWSRGWGRARKPRSAPCCRGRSPWSSTTPSRRYPLACREDLERLGIRLIAGPLAGAMCPIFQTSANLSGEPAPARFDDVPEGDPRRRRPGDRRRRAGRPALDRGRHRRDRRRRLLGGAPPGRPLRQATWPAASPGRRSTSPAQQPGRPRNGRWTRRREVLSFSFDSKRWCLGSTIIR